MICRECHAELMRIWSLQDIHMEFHPRIMYCGNEHCSQFGIVTVIGLPDSDETLHCKKEE